MTLSDAKIYVSRVLGGAGDSNILALAGDAILFTANKWTTRHSWSFLRKDNSVARTLTGTVADAGGGVGTVVTLTSTAGLNAGQGVTGGGLAAGATISSITSTTVIVLSSNATAGSQSLTFAAYLPIIAGTDHYFAPHDYHSGYSLLLLTTKATLEYIQPRLVDRIAADQTSQSLASHYTDAPPGSNAGFTAADQRARIRLIGIPGTTENGLLRYYRGIDGAATTVDMLDAYLYHFLEDAKAWLVRQKNADDPRINTLVGAGEMGLNDCIKQDMDNSEDEDLRLISQYEAFYDGRNTRGLPERDWY